MSDTEVKDKFSRLRSALSTDIGKIPSRYLAMFYGDTDAGKTIYALAHADQLVQNGRILYIDTGQGFLSIKNHVPLYKSLKPKLSVMPYSGETQLLLTAEAIEKKAPGFDFDCVIWDEGSSMYDQFLDVVTHGRVLADNQKGGDREPFLTSQPDYGIAGNKFRQAFEIYVGLPIHFIVLSHYRFEKTTLNFDRTTPAFPPRIAKDIRRPLHTIGFMENKYNRQTKQYIRTIQVHTTDTCTAKTRVGGFANEPVTDPKKFLRATLGWLKGEIPTEETEIKAKGAPLNQDDPEETEGVEVD